MTVTPEYKAQTRKEWDQVTAALADLHDALNTMTDPIAKRYAAQAMSASIYAVEHTPEDVARCREVGINTDHMAEWASQCMHVMDNNRAMVAVAMQFIGDTWLPNMWEQIEGMES